MSDANLCIDRHSDIIHGLPSVFDLTASQIDIASVHQIDVRKNTSFPATNVTAAKCVGGRVAVSNSQRRNTSSFENLGSCPAQWTPDDCVWYDRFPKDRIGAAVLAVYTQGGTVVIAGSTDCAVDPTIAKITRNV